MVDVDKLARRLDLLKSGKQLLLKHMAFGEYIVSMNPQHNRIFHETVLGETLSEDRINYLLMWNCGDWFLYEPPKRITCDCCRGTGYTTSTTILEKV